MAGTFASYFSVIQLILAVVIIMASFKVSRKRYHLSAGCFAGVVAVQAFFTVFPMCLGLTMANSFGPPVAVLWYLWPVLLAFLILVPAYCLFPGVPPRQARKITFFIAGTIIVLSLASNLVSLARGRTGGSLWSGGLEATYYLLLWLRVHNLRIALMRMEKQAQAVV